jgi:hypothetical protein
MAVPHDGIDRVQPKQAHSFVRVGRNVKFVSGAAELLDKRS